MRGGGGWLGDKCEGGMLESVRKTKCGGGGVVAEKKLSS